MVSHTADPEGSGIMIASKHEWRTQMRQASAEWLSKPAAERKTAYAALEKNLHQLLQSARGTWGSYSALADEPPVDVRAGALASLRDLRWAFPKLSPVTEASSNDMCFLIPETKDSFLKGAWGVREPDPASSKEMAPDELAGVLIPALAFDRAGIRLGRGKGFYDKWLSGFRGTKVGVAYSWQITTDELPRESFDIPMDIVVTEAETFRPERS